MMKMFKEDDGEVKEIIGRVIGYFIRIAFDDGIITAHEVTGAVQSLHEMLNEFQGVTQFKPRDENTQYKRISKEV